MVAASGIFGMPGKAVAEPVSIAPGDPVWTDLGQCTLGFILRGTDGAPRGLLAGHCGRKGEIVSNGDGRNIGVIVDVVRRVDDRVKKDTALMSFLPEVVANRSVLKYRSPSAYIAREDVKRVNPVLCKLGGITGITCGEIVDQRHCHLNQIAFVGGSRMGDSGAPVWTFGSDGKMIVVGTLSGAPPGDTTDITCVDPAAEYIKMWNLSLDLS